MLTNSAQHLKEVFTKLDLKKGISILLKLLVSCSPRVKIGTLSILLSMIMNNVPF